MKKTQGLKSLVVILTFMFSFTTVWSFEKSEASAEIEGLIAHKGQFHTGSALKAFYEQAGYETVWNDWYKRQELLSAMEIAEWDGLNIQDYHYDALCELHDNLTPTAYEAAFRDVLLTDAALLYREHMLYGKIEAKKGKVRKNISYPEASAEEILAALATPSIDCYLEYLRPQTTAYIGLQLHLVRYIDYAKGGDWNTVKLKETLAQGAQHEAISDIKQNLKQIQHLTATADESHCFDAELHEAIKIFQRENGLVADGAIGPATVKALNITPIERLAQLKINMERLRWMPLEQEDYYLTVNVPEYKLHYYKTGKKEKTMNVVVGKKSRQTPEFSAEMEYLVFNPTWTVPPTIKREDVIPAILKDPGYLTRKGMTALSGGKEVKLTKENLGNYNLSSLTYRQEAGSSNALGQVKFIFPNQHNVYIHDTPTKSHFKLNERAYSSGCIRVENPDQLAQWILEDQLCWSADSVKTHIAKRETDRMMLAETPMVHIVYHTAWVNDNYELRFAKDIYNKDSALQRRLEKASI